MDDVRNWTTELADQLEGLTEQLLIHRPTSMRSETARRTVKLLREGALNVHVVPAVPAEAEREEPAGWSVEHAHQVHDYALAAATSCSHAMQVVPHVPRELIDELEFALSSLNNVIRACVAYTRQASR